MCGCNNRPKYNHPTRPTRPLPGAGACHRPTFDPADPLNLGPLEPCAGVGTYINMPALGGMTLISCSAWPSGLPVPVPTPAPLPVPTPAWAKPAVNAYSWEL
jgi:hypothetical protein